MTIREKETLSYENMKLKIVDLEAEVDRLRAIIGEDGEYDYDECTGKFDRAFFATLRKESEERAKRVRITNTYGFKNE